MQAGPHDFTAANDGEDFETRVRALAYDLWQKEGGPEGREEEFWLRAEARLRAKAGDDVTLPGSEPHDAHDEAAAHSFPASDPPSSSGVTSLGKHDLPEGEHPVDTDVQEEVGQERRKAGGYS
jgi:hypothetical protein